MTEHTSDTGFQRIEHPVYFPEIGPKIWRDLILQQSPEVDVPRLLVGQLHLLDRALVEQLRDYLTRWLDTGQLFTPPADSTSAAKE